MDLKLLCLIVLSSVVLFLFQFGETQVAPPKVCKCSKIIPRSLITQSECGDCARCWYDLWHFADLFKAHDTITTSKTLLKTLQGFADLSKPEWEYCAQRIPYPTSHMTDADCKTKHDACNVATNDLFMAQCAKLATELGLPQLDKMRFDENAALQGVQKKPLFNGKNFFPQSCPSHYRKHFFTYHILFHRAFQKYLPQLEQDYWDENFSLRKVAEQISCRVVNQAFGDIQDIYNNFGMPLIKNKFCGFADVFICVDTC